MKTSTLLIALSALFAGCSAQPLMHPETAKAPPAAKDTASAKHGDVDETLDAVATTKTVADPRQPGDFVVFDFDGTYRTSPLELTERVVARTDKDITVEFAFTEKGKAADVLRVTTSLVEGHAGEVLHVAKRDAKGAFSDAPTEAYDSLLAMTVASADVNDEEISSAPTTETVGDKDLTVTKTTYRVQIGKAKATMSTLSSDKFAWGDVGGEITTTEGNVFYRAKLVKMGTDASSVASIDVAKDAEVH